MEKALNLENIKHLSMKEWWVSIGGYLSNSICLLNLWNMASNSMLYAIASRDTSWKFIFIPVTNNDLYQEKDLLIIYIIIIILCQIIKLKLFFIVNYVMFHFSREKIIIINITSISTSVYIYNYILQFYIIVVYVSTLYIFTFVYIWFFYIFYCKYYFLLYSINMHLYSKSNIFLTFFYTL